MKDVSVEGIKRNLRIEEDDWGTLTVYLFDEDTAHTVVKRKGEYHVYEDRGYIGSADNFDGVRGLVAEDLMYEYNTALEFTALVERSLEGTVE